MERRILKPRESFAQKEEDWQTIVSICSNEEPHLDLFAETLFQRILARTTPIGDGDKTYSLRGCTPLTVKRLLLEMHPQAIRRISGERFQNIVTSTSSPLPDPSKPYAGVYMAGYLQRRKQPMSIRTVLRIANILLDTARTKRALIPATAGSRLLKGCEALGKAWRMVLEDLKLWVDLYEFALDDDNPIDSPCPDTVKGRVFDQPFPFSPVYTGYSKTPGTRWSQHRAGNSLKQRSWLIVVPRGECDGILHVVNILNERCEGLDLELHALPLWTSFHQNHDIGRVCSLV